MTPHIHACIPPIELPITSEMVYTQVFGHQAILGAHLIVICIVRELRAQAVGGFRGFSGADGVGKNDVVRRGIERLAGTEQFACEMLRTLRKPAPLPFDPCRMTTGWPVGAPTVV